MIDGLFPRKGVNVRIRLKFRAIDKEGVVLDKPVITQQGAKQNERILDEFCGMSA